MKTKLGAAIPEKTRGILYLCEYDYDKETIKVVREIICESSFMALELYANIRNPESQLVQGKTYDDLITELVKLHCNLDDPKWVAELKEYL